MKKRSQRIDYEAMVTKAFEHPGCVIELDGNCAYLTILNVDYVATLDAHAASLDPAVEAQTWPGANRPRGRAS